MLPSLIKNSPPLPLTSSQLDGLLLIHNSSFHDNGSVCLFLLSLALSSLVSLFCSLPLPESVVSIVTVPACLEISGDFKGKLRKQGVEGSKDINAVSSSMTPSTPIPTAPGSNSLLLWKMLRFRTSLSCQTSPEPHRCQVQRTWSQSPLGVEGLSVWAAPNCCLTSLMNLSKDDSQAERNSMCS